MNDEVDEIHEVPTITPAQARSADLTGLVASVDPAISELEIPKLKKKRSTEVGCQHVTIKVEGVRGTNPYHHLLLRNPEEGLTMPVAAVADVRVPSLPTDTVAASDVTTHINVILGNL